MSKYSIAINDLIKYNDDSDETFNILKEAVKKAEALDIIEKHAIDYGDDIVIDAIFYDEEYDILKEAFGELEEE